MNAATFGWCRPSRASTANMARASSVRNTPSSASGRRSSTRTPTQPAAPQDQLVSSIWAGGQAAAAAVLITRAAAASAQPVSRRLEPRSSRTEPAAMISAAILRTTPRPGTDRME